MNTDHDVRLRPVRLAFVLVALTVVAVVALPLLAVMSIFALGATTIGEIREDTTPSTHLVRDVSDILTTIRPSRFVLDTLVRRLQRRRGGMIKAQAVKYEWEEDASIPRSTTLPGTQVFGTGAVAMNVAPGTGVYFRPDDIWYLPDNVTTPGFLLHVMSVATDAVTVRGFYSATSETAYTDVPDTAPGEVIKKLGRARQERFTAGEPIATMPAQLYNYCQLYEAMVSWSLTRAATKNYTLKDTTRNERQVLYDLRQDLEYSRLFGQRGVIADATDGKNRWFAGGIAGQFISTNDITYTAGSLTESILIDWAKQVGSGRNGSAVKWLFTTPALTAEIDKLLITSGSLQHTRDQTVLGVMATRIHSTFCDFLLFNHDGLTEMGKTNYGIIVDPMNVGLAGLLPMSFKDVTLPNVHGKDVQWSEQSTLVCRHEATHAVVRAAATDSLK